MKQMQCHNGKSITEISIWNTWETHVKHPWICLFHMWYWNFTCEKTCEISHVHHVTFQMWNFTSDFSHVKSHMWEFTCGISHLKSHVEFHIWNFTCKRSHDSTCKTSHGKFHMGNLQTHVKFQMWNFTCEISHVKILIWKFTCEISNVKHMWNTFR